MMPTAVFLPKRSPFLACMFGLCSALRYCSLTYEYALIWRDDPTVPEYWIASFIAYPAQLTAEIALVLIAFRLLVMFYPAKRWEPLPRMCRQLTDVNWHQPTTPSFRCFERVI